ncbi:MAG: ATP-dependent Clp protease proteolytic subunit [Candidatus Eremiobacteraeota bacterium]|nr:ATP-dependent Clp protease proteolytic subunit [Candidatus Eremiobacteraeota bacterium]
MKAMRWPALLWCCLLLCGFGGLIARAQVGRPVVIVPITGTVDDGMAHLVQRSVDEANQGHARAVVLDVNSPGGLVSAAFAIRDALFSAQEPVVAYVGERAYSAAALISLAANRIIMAPGASIGAAEPVEAGGAVPPSDKIVSALRGEFESTAQRNHRDPKLAGAMVDKNVNLPEYKRSGMVLTLNTDDAVRSGIASGTAPTLDAALAQLHLADAPRVTESFSWAEQIARFATDPVVSGLLLTLGMLGLLIEMQTLHGIAGIIGVGALALFFGTHVYAGFSNGFVAALAVLGLLGILWELHVVPGHGLPGILGAAALLVAVLLAFGLPFFFVGVETIATAIVLTVIIFTLVVRAVPQNAWADRLALAAAQGPDYVASADYGSLRGRIGKAVSYLRPAGIASIEGRRVDVLTEGEFIAQGTPIRVVRVEGARVFVEPVA